MIKITSREIETSEKENASEVSTENTVGYTYTDTAATMYAS